MKNTLGKVFKYQLQSGDTELVVVDYDPTNDYYSFLKERFSDGYRQVIITSHVMMAIVKDYFLTKHFKIINIEFMVEDEELEEEIKFILNKIDTDRAYYHALVNKLNFLIEESSIDIKKVELKGKSQEGDPMSIFIQVNGIIGITDNCFKTENSRLIEMIKGTLKI